MLGFLGAVLPTQSPPLPSPASHFQGDSSFVIMTNFIATLQQVQGYCAEVRTANCPLAPILGPIGENNMEEEVPLVIKDRLPRGNAMVEF